MHQRNRKLRVCRCFFRLAVDLVSFLILCALLSCNQQPAENLVKFKLELPASATEGQTVGLTITAVGSNSSTALTSYEETVNLSVSAGRISQQTISLVKGQASTELLFRDAQGVLSVTVQGGQISSSEIITIRPLKTLDGLAETVEEVLPEISFTPREEDYRNDHPVVPGVDLSINTLLLSFKLGTTASEANEVLESLDAEIVGAIPGTQGQIESILILRLPTRTHGELEQIIASLEANLKVGTVVQDILLDSGELEPELSTAAIPSESELDSWTWDLDATGSNWCLETIRVPQMWNLNPALEKLGNKTQVGILDTGFANSHPDVSYNNLTPNNEHDHGTRVAGRIGAQHNNGGIDGINPFAELTVGYDAKLSALPALNFDFTRRTSMGSIMTDGLFRLMELAPSVKVVNISLAYNWYSIGINTNSSSDPKASFARQLASSQGKMVSVRMGGAKSTQAVPLLVSAAGNDSFNFPLTDAKYASPFNNAALEHGVESILVIEAVGNRFAGTTSYSNVKGHFSAPAADYSQEQCLSTSHPVAYEGFNGTSDAAPHVTGLISYLYTLDPSLSQSDILNLLNANSTAVVGIASKQIDAFATVMDIDRVQGNTEVLKMLLDIDDGTADGNQRTIFDSTVDFTDEDADLDGGTGDGSIDMSDFRRWRDWLLQIEASESLLLDASAEHPKKDPNTNGAVESPEDENIYPRGDFNGDGILSRVATRHVTGALNATVTDLDALKRLFQDPNYQASQLDELIDSVDIAIDLSACLSNSDLSDIQAGVFATGDEEMGSALEFRTFSSNADALQVFTVPANVQLYTVVANYTLPAGGGQEEEQKDFVLALGEDAYYKVLCPVEEESAPAPPPPPTGISVIGSWSVLLTPTSTEGVCDEPARAVYNLFVDSGSASFGSNPFFVAQGPYEGTATQTSFAGEHTGQFNLSWSLSVSADESGLSGKITGPVNKSVGVTCSIGGVEGRYTLLGALITPFDP